MTHSDVEHPYDSSKCSTDIDSMVIHTADIKLELTYILHNVKIRINFDSWHCWVGVHCNRFGENFEKLEYLGGI